MDENIEYNFITNQINANNQIRSILNHEIATLAGLIHQKKDWLRQTEEQDRELQIRARAIGDKNKTIVKYY